MRDYREEDESEFSPDKSKISECCGAYSLYELYEDRDGNFTGICSKCRDHATFINDIEDER